MKVISLALTFCLFSTLCAQVTNVDCANATNIANPQEYCSGVSEWSNDMGGGSEFEATGCFMGVENDVWFRFTAIGSAVNILVNGDVGGTLRNPRIVLYSGSCESEEINILGCEASDGGADIVNLISNNLAIGVTYYVKVGGAGDNQGSFQLCINNFNPPVEPGQDTNTAAVLCDKSGFVIQALSGGGANNDEASGTCLDVGYGPSENQSSWTSWIADNNGELSFTITPINTNDDIDFVLYELPNGVDNYVGKTAIRCMASSCIGPTGLNSSSTDLVEMAGCGPGDDNFVRSVIQEEGKAYALLINNFSSTGIGISLSFSGSAEFKGPEPDFNLTVADANFTCDKIIDFTDDSQGNLGNLISYEWNFGEDAVPATGTGEGPFEVSYETFGPKFIALTITSDLGCKITEVREIEISPCCDDPSGVRIDVVEQENIGCGTAELGSFSIQGSGGFPTYTYSFDGGEYVGITTFTDLPVGDYEVGLLDRKGCEITRTVSIVEVETVTADAGEDLEIEFLGDSIRLNGSLDASDDVTVTWSPSENLTCNGGGVNCLDPVVRPDGTTTYTLFVADASGCVATDEVVVEVLKVRPLFAANVFSPNEDGINDRFFLSGSPRSISNILELNVYDRWGNPVYAGRNLTLNDLSGGWDGLVNGSPADEGVYVWYARLEFLDPESPTELITGDVTLVR